MITPAFNITATERVLPKLALDFTTASLDSRVTFTRTTGASNPATYTDSNGYVVAATNNQPRFDYDPVALICKGLLIEESRINIALQSNGFSTVATWPVSRAGMAATGASGTSPDGTNNAYKLNEDTGGLSKFISQAITATNVVNTFSVYVKAAGRTNIELAVIGSANYGAAYDLTALTVGANVAGFTQATSATIADAGNGWRRCTITQNAAAGSSLTCRIYLSTGAAINYTGNGTSGVLLYGAQLEAGAFATSYIPTTTAALTRNADVATMTGTNFSDWYNASEGTFVAQTVKPNSNFNTTAIVLEAGDGTVNNRFSLQALSSTTGVFSMTTSGTAKTTTVSAGYNAAVVKAAGSYIVNNLNYAVNAVAGGAETTISIPTVDRLYIGSLTVFGLFWNGHIQKINYYPQAVSVAQLQAFTK